MRWFSLLAAVGVSVASLTLPVAAQNATYTFDSHTVTAALPEGYTLVDESTSVAGYKSLAFATAPHQDGTRSVIQVAIFDLARMGAQTVTLDDFATQMVESMRQAHSDWQSGDTTANVMGVSAKRVQWSATTATSSGKRIPVRGVMLLGIKDGVGFRLEAQDTDTRAAQSVARAEEALKTVALLKN